MKNFLNQLYIVKNFVILYQLINELTQQNSNETVQKWSKDKFVGFIQENIYINNPSIIYVTLKDGKKKFHNLEREV